MIIDHKQLNADTLTSLIEAYINRGDHAVDDTSDTDLPTTVALLKRKLDQQELHLTFDHTTESVNLLTPEALNELENAPASETTLI